MIVLTYRIVERPMRFTWRTGAVIPPLAVAMSVLLAAGFTVSAHQGYIERPINRNDAARLVDYYDRMYYHTLGAAYRFECDFNDRDTKTAPHVVIVNETFARKFLNGANPIGHHLRQPDYPDRPAFDEEIVGTSRMRCIDRCARRYRRRCMSQSRSVLNHRRAFRSACVPLEARQHY